MLTQLTRTRIFIHTHTSFMHIQSLTYIYNITHAQTTSYIHTHRQHDTCTDNLMHAQTSYRRTQPFKALAPALNLTLSPPLVQPLVPPLVEPLVAPSLGLDTAPCRGLVTDPTTTLGDVLLLPSSFTALLSRTEKNREKS